MAPLLRQRTARLIALLLYVLASATIGFAHHPVATPLPADLAQFALPDGTLPIICGQNRTGKHDKGGGHNPFCAACRLTSAPGLLAAPTIALVLRIATASILDPPSQELAHDIHAPAEIRARGPPGGTFLL